MLGDISKAEKIYIATGYTDMRKFIDGLAAIVQKNFELNPFQNSLFLFCGRKRDRMKALYFEGDGLCASIQEIGKWTLSVASKCPGSKMYNATGISMAA